jgi:hypothetical protein
VRMPHESWIDEGRTVTLTEFLLARIAEDEREASDWPDILA